MHPFGRAILAIALLQAFASAAAAQIQLHGRIIEHISQEPIAAANVVLQEADGRKLAQYITNALGEFHFVVNHKGPVRLKAEHLGYTSVVTTAIDLKGYTTYQVEVRMAVSGVVLAALEVIARDRGPTLAGFDQRRTSSIGAWFITAEEIEQRRVNKITDVLATAPGIWFKRSGQERIAYTRGACPAQVYVDGFLINRGTGAGMTRRAIVEAAIDELVKPGSVYGIEVYQGMSKVPPEFMTPEAKCGVILIWTRRGS